MAGSSAQRTGNVREGFQLSIKVCQARCDDDALTKRASLARCRSAFAHRRFSLTLCSLSLLLYSVQRSHTQSLLIFLFRFKFFSETSLARVCN